MVWTIKTKRTLATLCQEETYGHIIKNKLSSQVTRKEGKEKNLPKKKSFVDFICCSNSFICG